jgi:hypothetical protein
MDIVDGKKNVHLTLSKVITPEPVAFILYPMFVSFFLWGLRISRYWAGELGQQQRSCLSGCSTFNGSMLYSESTQDYY